MTDNKKNTLLDDYYSKLNMKLSNQTDYKIEHVKKVFDFIIKSDRTQFTEFINPDDLSFHTKFSYEEIVNILALLSSPVIDPEPLLNYKLYIECEHCQDKLFFQDLKLIDGEFFSCIYCEEEHALQEEELRIKVLFYLNKIYKPYIQERNKSMTSNDLVNSENPVLQALKLGKKTPEDTLKNTVPSGRGIPSDYFKTGLAANSNPKLNEDINTRLKHLKNIKEHF